MNKYIWLLVNKKLFSQVYLVDSLKIGIQLAASHFDLISIVLYEIELVFENEKRLGASFVQLFDVLLQVHI